MIELYVYFILYCYIQILYCQQTNEYNQISLDKNNLLKCIKEEEYSRWRRTSEASDFLSKVLSKDHFHRNY